MLKVCVGRSYGGGVICYEKERRKEEGEQNKEFRGFPSVSVCASIASSPGSPRRMKKSGDGGEEPGIYCFARARDLTY